MPAQFTMPPDTRSVGTADPPNDANALIRAANAAGAGFNVLNAAFAGGADPTGAANSAPALQACITAAAAAGQPVTIPPGTYTTNTTLNCKYTGLVISAPGGSDNTIISCTGSNIPVAQFAGSYQDISGLTFTYATQQTSGQTAANAVTFGDDTTGSCFQGNYHELQITKAQTGMAINPAITTVAGIFSCRLANITINLCSSSFINLSSNNGLGGANCTGCVFDNLYLGGSSGTMAGIPVLMKNWDEFVFNQLNIEHYTVTSQDVLCLSSCANAVFNSVHFEGLTTSLNGGSLLHQSGAGTTVINGMSVRFSFFTGSASNPVINFVGAGPATLIINGLNDASSTVTTPSRPLVNFGTATNCDVQITGQTGSQATVTQVNAGAGDAVKIVDPGSGAFLCPPTQYAPAATTLATSSLTMSAVSSANVSTGSFTAPASGNVLVTVTLVANNATSGNSIGFALAAHGTVSPLLSNAVLIQNNIQKVLFSPQFLVTGLTPGTSYNLDLLFNSPSATAVTVYVVGQTSTTSAAPGGPVTMTVQAV